MNYIYINTFYSNTCFYNVAKNSSRPFFIVFDVFCLTSGFVFYMHEYKYEYICAFVVLSLGLFISLTTIHCWCRDVVREATFEGNHTFKVRKGLKVGMISFILSGALFYINLRYKDNFFYSLNDLIYGN